jgi:Flp pilus assembly protein TadG
MKQLKSERGVAIIYVTLFLIVLGLLFFALGIDVGWLAYVRSQSQTAVDAAALAGAAGIPNYNTTGDSTVVDNLIQASDNSVIKGPAGLKMTDAQFCGGSSSSPTCPWANSKTAGGVKVTRTFQAPIFFGRLLDGKSTADITVSSTAWLGGAQGLRPDLDVAICGNPPPAGVGYDPSDPDGPTCRTTAPTIDFSPSTTNNGAWWAFGTNINASNCRDFVNHPDTIPFVQRDDSINLNNGQITSCMKAVDDRFEACTPTICNGPDSPTKRACTVIIPIITCPGGPITGSLPVQGFAAMCITDVVSNPASNASIQGNLICNVTAEAVPGAPFFGIYPDHAALVK